MAQSLDFFPRKVGPKVFTGVTIYFWIYGREFECCFYKGASHMAKKLIFAAMLAAALSSGALSVHQLRTGTHAIVACGSPCTSGDICKRPCGCYFGLGGGTTGTCQPEGPAPSPTK